MVVEKRQVTWEDSLRGPPRMSAYLHMCVIFSSRLSTTLRIEMEVFYCRALKWGGTLPPRGHLAMSTDIFSSHSFGGGVGTTGIKWVETREAATHPAVHGTAPTTESALTPLSPVPRLRDPGLRGV